MAALVSQPLGRFRRRTACAAALTLTVVGMLGAAASAQATTVLDSLTGWPGVGLTYASNEVVAQPFTAPADPVLDRIEFPAQLLSAGSITATVSVYAWDGTQIVGPPLAVSAPLTVNTTGGYIQRTPVMPDVSLVPGQDYAIFFESSPGPQIALGQWSLGSVSGFGQYRVKVGAGAWQDSLSGNLMAMRLTFITPAPPPPIASVTLTDIGSPSGGQQLTIRGANFSDGTQVLFGDTPADVRVDRYDRLTVTVPPHAPGTVAVTIVTPSGRTVIGIYTYAADAAAASGPPAPAAITAQSPARCVVPDLRGLTVSEAREQLSAARCQLGHVRRVRSRRATTTARVVRQSRAAASTAVAGATVNVTVSRR